MKKIVITDLQTDLIYVFPFDSSVYDENDIEEIQRFLNHVEETHNLSLDIDYIMFTVHDSITVQIF